jgi:hypothetical protein
MTAVRPALVEGRTTVAPTVLAFFRAASGYLHRQQPVCPVHGVAHTGKLARAVVLDLCLFDATGGEVYWERAVERAAYVADRLAPDSEHGGLIYLPGRFDPRNCSNSVIDSGECTDALGRLLLHPRAAELPPSLAERLRHAVLGNAQTYLRTAVVEKEITNQRLWGAMGLATAWQLEPRNEWAAALRQSLERSVAEQRADGSWAYQPDAPRYGAHPGAADLTVYYHGRCLAFMEHILERVPAADPDGASSRALERGLDFLDAVTLRDGTKPLALEGKRWFWDGSYEAGSNAYDVFALVRGAWRFDRPHWRETATRAWRQLMRHQRPDGSIQACLDRGARDFVCPDFHTADLAWTAQVMGEVSVAEDQGGAAGSLVRQCPEAGVLRLDWPGRAVIIRTDKEPANTQFGGAVGGGSLAAVADGDGRPLLAVDRDGLATEAAFVCQPRVSWSSRLAAVRRFVRQNQPGREGRQWLFVARLLAARGDVRGAAARLWRGVLRPLLDAFGDPVSSRWAAAADVTLAAAGQGVLVSSPVCRADGSTPAWAETLRVAHRYEPNAGRLRVTDRLGGEVAGVGGVQVVSYLLPRAAQDVSVRGTNCDVMRTAAGRRVVVGRPAGGAFALEVRYWL